MSATLVRLGVKAKVAQSSNAGAYSPRGISTRDLH